MYTNLINPDDFSLLDNGSVTEEGPKGKKTREFLFAEEGCSELFERLQGMMKEIDYMSDENILNIFSEMSECKTLTKTLNLAGEYYSDTRQIKYYDQTAEELVITKIHERFHAVNHLSLNQAGEIWENFSVTPSFYLELLAQLFSWIYIRDYQSSLVWNFRTQNDHAPYIYQTYKMFEDYTQQEAEDLYWVIRNRNLLNPTYKALEVLNNLLANNLVINEVAQGIRTTINRFRENPFLYFTESDIHASLKADILSGNSDLFYKNLHPAKRVQISLVHLEYPTNFAFSRRKLAGKIVEGDHYIEQRGNFDLVVLSPGFIDKVSNHAKSEIIELLKGIIAKDFKKYKFLHGNEHKSGDELLYVIEVKFIHLSTPNNIVNEIDLDNQKLALALDNCPHIRPINLVFCYFDSTTTSVTHFKNVLPTVPPNILNIFIEVNMDNSGNKGTSKPLFFYNNRNPEWVQKIIDNYRPWQALQDSLFGI